MLATYATAPKIGEVIAVSGANGFVGKALCDQLQSQGFVVRRLVRTLSGSHDNEFEVGDINAETDWSTPLAGVTTIVHCAARTHVMNDSAKNSLKIYQTVNVDGTRCLAENAARLGVQRLVFLSSVKVNGEQTSSPSEQQTCNGFSVFDDPDPQDSYGITKLEAEQTLWRESLRSGLKVVIIRAPLVYGPGVKGNFLRLIRIVQQGWPLPFSLVNNRRSLVALDNLLNLLVICIKHPSAPGQTFLVSDGEDISTPELIRGLAKVMNVPARLFPVPPFFLQLGGSLFGRRKEIDRLIGTLQVDISHTRKVLEWSPPILLEEGLRRTVVGE